LVEQLIRANPFEAGRVESVNLANSLRAALFVVGVRPKWPTKYDLPMQGLLVLAALTAECVMRRRWEAG
jgi:hypothetical protein